MDERRARWDAIARLIGSHRVRVAVLAVSSLIAGFVEAGFLVLVTVSALAVTDGRETLETFRGIELTIGAALALAGGLLLVRLALVVVNTHLSTALTIDVAKDLRHRLAASFLGASWATQQAERSGHLQQLLSDFAQRTVNIVTALATSITAGLSLAALVLVAAAVDIVSTIGVVVVLLALGSLLLPLRRRIKTRARAASKVTMRFATSVSELGSMGLEMQAFGRRDAFADRIGSLIEEEGDAWRRADFLRASVGPVYTTLGYAAVLVGLGIASSVGVQELATVGAVILLMLRCLSYGQSAQVASANLVNSLPYLETLDATLDRYEANPAQNGTLVVEHVAPLAAHDLTFAYLPGHDVLHALSFEIDAGEAVGIVGPSGGGKSTLVQLLLGLRAPTGGRITAAGHDLTEVDRASWTAKLAFVPQEPLLFSGTVAENIAFFRDLDRAAIEDAARRAHIHDEITRLPEGYATPVGERGGRLSGGQKQRLSIARALAGGPELLILDEPTSSLDVHSEELIRNTLTELKGQVTIVVIAHRLTTLDMCDRTMVIEHGHLLAFDHPSVLASSSPFFRKALELSELS